MLSRSYYDAMKVSRHLGFYTLLQTAGTNMEASKIWCLFGGVPVIRTTVYWGVYQGPIFWKLSSARLMPVPLPAARASLTSVRLVRYTTLDDRNPEGPYLPTLQELWQDRIYWVMQDEFHEQYRGLYRVTGVETLRFLADSRD